METEREKSGMMEHEESETCWCEPELSYVDPYTGVAVWVHRETH